MARALRGSQPIKGQTKSEDCLETHENQIRQLKSDAAAEYAPVNCDEADTNSLKVVLDLLETEIQDANDNIEAVRATQASNEEMKENRFVSFGDNLTPNQRVKVDQFILAEKQKKVVPLQHALVLVQHLVEMKNKNIELDNTVKELEARLSESGQKNVTVENDVVGDINGENGTGSIDYGEFESSSSDEELIPVDGVGLLGQIQFLEKKEIDKSLGFSQREKKSKPVAQLSSNKKSDLSKTTKSFSKPVFEDEDSEEDSVEANTEAEKQELERLFEVVTNAFQTQILDIPRHSQSYQDYIEESTEAPTHISVTKLEKLRAHFDCLKEIEDVHGGNFTDNTVLRDVLKKSSFLLGLEVARKKSAQVNFKTIKRSQQRLREEWKNLKKDKESLEKTVSHHYDIDFDDY